MFAPILFFASSFVAIGVLEEVVIPVTKQVISLF
jgi:hypothetical protein